MGNPEPSYFVFFSVLVLFLSFSIICFFGLWGLGLVIKRCYNKYTRQREARQWSRFLVRSNAEWAARRAERRAEIINEERRNANC